MRKIILSMAMVFMVAMPVSVQAASSLTYVDVNGMVCDFCARAIEKVFGQQEAVSSVDVNLDDKFIAIEFSEDQTLSDEKITELVTHAGYDVRQIRRDVSDADDSETKSDE